MINLSTYGRWLIAVLACCAVPSIVITQQSHQHTIEPTVTAQGVRAPGTFFGQAPDRAKTRRYFIAAETQLWDYAPQGLDPVMGKPLPPTIAAKRKGPKIRYVQYTDETFQSRVFETPRLGLLGPTLRGVVGDYLEVTFLNRTDQPLSLHPHGVKYDKDSEGAYYQPSPGRGAAVGAGASFTYVWQLDEGSGPLDSEPSSKGWLYHSHVNGDEEINLGLIGSIIVTDPKRARADGTPVDIDREMVSLFMIFDESGLSQAAKEAAEYGLAQMKWAELQEQLELGARYAINGYVFGNLPGLEVNQDERVRWYLFGLGSETDFHTAHWHGLRVVEEGRRRTDVVDLLPATMKVADLVADNPGTWMFQCHVAEHMMEGMYAPLVVHPKGSGGTSAPAFLGLRSTQQSMLIHRSQMGECAPGSGACAVSLEGTATVHNVFSVLVDPVVLQLGSKRVSFTLDRRGVASTPDGTFRVTNANEFGVVYGGLLKFEAVLSGDGWRAELSKLGVDRGTRLSQDITVPIKVEIGTAQHLASVEVSLR